MKSLFKMMTSALIIQEVDFYTTTSDSLPSKRSFRVQVIKMMNSVFKMMNSVFKMMIFAF